MIAGGALLLAVGAGIYLAASRPSSPELPALSPIAAQALEWKQAGLASGVAPGLNPRAVAEQRVAAGRAALAADLPERIPEALRAFRDALVADPARLDALAGWVVALASQPVDTIRGEDLTAAHELLQWARERNPERAELVAAYARILLAVPGDKNRAEALSVAWRAGALAPRDPDARLALGLSRLETDAPGAARVLDAELDHPELDRRLLTAAARARWAAGDVDRALALAERRLALDPGHPEALELEAEILVSGGQTERAKGVLQRYAGAHPESPRPPFLLARISAQVDRRLPDARRLLGAALALRCDDFLAARILAQLSAVERAAGDPAAAQRAVDAALQRVPASAPAQFQAALLAFARGDVRAVREAAGVIGERGGSAVAAAVRARDVELSSTADDAAGAWEAAAASAPREPAQALAAAGALARLGFPGRAVAVAERVFQRDLFEGRLQRAVGDFWDGAPPLAEASRRLGAVRGPANEVAGALAAAGAAELLQGRSEKAEELGRRALTLGPQLPAPSTLLAYVALDRADPRGAAAWARAALDLQPGQPASLAVMARALEATGKRLEAQGAWREALEGAPDLATGRLALARLLILDGRAEEARPLLEALVRDDPGVAEAVGALRELGRTKPASR
ncbi:MAG TPA: tetratricopeptide repeat protein [Anaeromyxobacteraceae bacterium]|nr:tetratricopeptide repeat protein [Anaeromyxobacteraceae bacterium]